ncbi:MAG: hypothetical protein B7Y53_01525 [Halothiobacillus sp. 28-55-5]|nr:MAG: hypothetical protein B7Y53_01525 [Halothiobacillus sp. 28-55-5]
MKRTIVFAFGLTAAQVRGMPLGRVADISDDKTASSRQNHPAPRGLFGLGDGGSFFDGPPPQDGPFNGQPFPGDQFPGQPVQVDQSNGQPVQAGPFNGQPVQTDPFNGQPVDPNLGGFDGVNNNLRPGQPVNVVPGTNPNGIDNGNNNFLDRQPQNGQTQNGQQRNGQPLDGQLLNGGNGAACTNLQAVQRAVRNWQQRTSIVSDFLSEAANLPQGQVANRAARALQAENEELTSKATIDQNCRPDALQAANSVLEGGAFQRVVDSLQRLAQNGNNLSPGQVATIVQSTNQNRCRNVLPNIDEYFRVAQVQASAVRPAQCRGG